MKREYVCVNGKIIIHEYFVRNMKHRCKCPNCNTVLVYLYYRKNKKMRKLGFKCPFCKSIFIDKKYKKIFSIDFNDNLKRC